MITVIFFGAALIGLFVWVCVLQSRIVELTQSAKVHWDLWDAQTQVNRNFHGLHIIAGQHMFGADYDPENE